MKATRNEVIKAVFSFFLVLAVIVLGVALTVIRWEDCREDHSVVMCLILLD